METPQKMDRFAARAAGRRRALGYKVTLLLVLAVCLAISGLAQHQLNRQRSELSVSFLEPLQDAPPVLAFVSTSLGGFKGLVSSLLWFRVNELQNEKKYAELVQLTDWITKLQPFIPMVWTDRAWNLTYNISVAHPNPVDRWHYVYQGISLLRDEGLRYNPQEPLLYHELSWHFQHKLGQNLDQHHFYYKQQWLNRMTEVLWDTPQEASASKGRPDFDRLINPDNEKSAARRKRLVEEYKIDPIRMKEVDTIYGPLEWRLPEVHSIYWAWLGMEKCKENPARKNILKKLQRSLFQSMQMTFVRGKLVFDPYSKSFDYGANLEIIKKANQAYVDMAEQLEEKDIKEGVFDHAHWNFVRHAISQLYLHNQQTEAREWLKYLVKHFPKKIDFEPTFVNGNINLDDFCLHRIEEDIKSGGQDRAKSLVEGLIGNAYYFFTIGEDGQAEGHLLMAKRVVARYEARSSTAETGRVDLPPFEYSQKLILHRFLYDTNTPPAMQAALRSRLGIGATEKIALPPPPIRTSTNSIVKPKL